MVDFRYHLVSIVAVFLALAVGIVLGAGPLKNASDQQLRDQVQAVRTDNDGLRDQLTASRAQTGEQDQFASQLGPGLVARRLTGTPVVLVVLPDADEAIADSVSDLLVTAGATVTGTVRIRSTWTGSDAGTRFAEALGSVSPSPGAASGSPTAPGGPAASGTASGTPAAPATASGTASPSPGSGPSETPSVSASSSPADLSYPVARLLAGAVLGPPPTALPSSAVPSASTASTSTPSASTASTTTASTTDPSVTSGGGPSSSAQPDPSSTIRSPGPFTGRASAPQPGVVNGPALQALSSAGLIDTAGDLTARASSVVVVARAAPDGDQTDETRAGVDRLVLLTRVLRGAGSAEVVAGPDGAARAGGVVAAVRTDAGASSIVSTVDSADHPAGAVAVVLALLEQVQGGVGDYGAVGTTDGSVPEIAGVSGQ